MKVVSVVGARPQFKVAPVSRAPAKRWRCSAIRNSQSAICNLQLLEPVGYLDMVMLEQAARVILTDSGGIQKEAYWLGVPCVTLRDETEWVETVQAGWNVLAGADSTRIVQAVQSFAPPTARPVLYGDGQAAERVIRVLETEGQVGHQD